MKNELIDLLNSRKYSSLIEVISDDPSILAERSEEGVTPMHEICQGAPVEVVRKIIEFGAPVSIKDRHGKTPLWWALDGSQFETAEFLLSQGATLDVQDSQGRYLIHEAALYGETEVIRFLISKGFPIDQRTPEGKTALHYAATSSPDLIDFLINEGADVDARDQHGFTPLHLAIMANDVDVSQKQERAQRLIEAGSDIYALAENGASPWTEAAKYDVSDLTALLLKYGDPPESSD